MLAASPFIALGLCTHDPETGVVWLVISTTLYAVPLLMQLGKSTWSHVYGFALGGFLMLQALSALYLPDTLMTNPPNMDVTVMIEGDNLRGIYGLQHFRTDHLGYRSTREVNYEDSHPYRIFLIGASTVAQNWLGNEATMAHWIQTSMQEQHPNLDIEVINTAVPGLRAVHQLSTLRRVQTLHPDLIVVVPGANDWGLQIVRHYDAQTAEQLDHTAVHIAPRGTANRMGVEWQRLTLKHTPLGRVVRRLAVAAPDADGAMLYTDAAWYAQQRGSLGRRDVRTFNPHFVSASFERDLDLMIDACSHTDATCLFASHPHAIGSFQALKHRAANMFCEIELSKSCVLEALTALDEGRDSQDVAKLASLTKAKVGETFNLVSREGIQMHGGIGMTDEFDIGFFIKRAAVTEQTFGDVNFHRNRYGELEGY